MDFYGDFRGIFYGLVWGFNGDFMGFSWDFMDKIMEMSCDLNGIFRGSSPPEPKVIGDEMAGIGLKIAV